MDELYCLEDYKVYDENTKKYYDMLYGVGLCEPYRVMFENEKHMVVICLTYNNEYCLYERTLVEIDRTTDTLVVYHQDKTV